MALVLVCVAGVWIGFAFDLAVLIYAMAFAGPAAFLVCAGAGIGHALLIAGGILIALQVGFAVGLASQWASNRSDLTSRRSLVRDWRRLVM